MARVKVCPQCGHHNGSGDIECSECSCDLSGVNPVSEEFIEQQKKEAALESELKKEDTFKEQSNAPAAQNNLQTDTSKTQSSSSEEVMVKICPKCGAENTGVKRFCTKCKESIKSVKGIYKKKAAEETSVRPNIPAKEELSSQQKISLGALKSPDNTFSFTLDSSRPVFEVGRENLMAEYLEKRLFVSRRHAQFQMIDIKFAVRDLNSTNGTYVNNEKLAPQSLRLLECGDKISFGGKWPDDPLSSNVGCLIVDYS